MRRLKDIHPDYAEQVDIFLVDTDPSESASRIRSYKESQGFYWPMAETEREILRSYNIVSQASKVAIDRNGVIVSRSSYESDSERSWRELLESLAGS